MGKPCDESAKSRGSLVPGGWPKLARAIVTLGVLLSATQSLAETTEPPTYSRDVAPILQAKCLSCHRPNQSAPFALETYEQARKRAGDIATVVIAQDMPPWKPEPGVGPRLQHDLSLTPEEIATIEAWADAGAPQGDPAHQPPLPRFAEGWARGTPDLVLEPSEAFTIPASGPDLYRCFVLPTNLPRDVYITMIDYRPANPRVVHHITAYVDTSGAARKREKAEPGPGYTSFSGPGIPVYDMLGFWAAGHQPTPLPAGVGFRLARGTDIIVQVHYHPTGKPEQDRPRLGLYFSRTPVKQAMHWNAAQNFQFELPPGAANTEVRASWFVPVELEALAVSPHMHLLGRDIRMSVAYPDGRTLDLISIPRWDPAWQGTYHFAEPVPLPTGSVVHVVAHFDNSDHARNPNQPPRPVRWGHNADDEMCDGFLAVVKKNQDLTQPRARDDLAEIFIQQRLRAIRREVVRKTR
jgi:hypothetical protein